MEKVEVKEEGRRRQGSYVRQIFGYQGNILVVHQNVLNH